jgi:hypothetical protein
MYYCCESLWNLYPWPFEGCVRAYNTANLVYLAKFKEV